MTPRTRLTVGALVVVGVALAVPVAWWATGLRPFTAAADAAVGLPVAALAAFVVARSPRPGHPVGGPGPSPVNLGTALPWVVLLVVAVGLEGAGLALGGRAPAVPTLSTVVDHALTWHGIRFLLFCGWLAAGWVPALRWAAGRPGAGRAGGE